MLVCVSLGQGAAVCSVQGCGGVRTGLWMDLFHEAGACVAVCQALEKTLASRNGKKASYRLYTHFGLDKC